MHRHLTKVEVYRSCRQMLLSAFLLILPALTFCQYRLHINFTDKDSSFKESSLGLQHNFKNGSSCREYVNKIPDLLQKKGFPTASIDSVYYDSLDAHLQLYLGQSFHWAHITTDSIDPRILEAAGWNDKFYKRHSMDVSQLQLVQTNILDYFENNGHPFAKVGLDSIRLLGMDLYAHLKVDPGPVYKIDSIRNFGNAKISSNFLQRYLNIMNGSIYKKDRLQAISKRVLELPYLTEQKPWDLSLLGTGSILNVYLEPKKSSQVDVLVGFLPANDQLSQNKLLVTGEANINLRNALGNGETIGVNWQQVQVKSPRLNLLYQQPYIFGSAFGVNFNFNLLKKDSTYVNVALMAGLQYSVSAVHSGSIFIQSLITNLLTVDTNAVKNTRQLPEEADVSSVNFGVAYDLFQTDYRFNPRKGNEVHFTGSIGTKSIKKNNVIVKLHDESDPSFDFNSLYDTLKLNTYQLRLKLGAMHYFPLTRVSTFKVAFNGGWFQSPSLFRNELFQIGGYRLLRGFDEESIYASLYGVMTGEYHYLLGQNSFLFSFIDGGWVKNAIASSNPSQFYLGAGLGMAFETRAGIFNISLAAGKKDETGFNLRQAKIHLGYVNYF
jgi:outer membrane protein assembly factor BamA